MWIRAVNAIDLRGLAVAERLSRIEAPNSLQQTLPAQHFMNSRDASGKTVGGVEKRGVRVGDFDVSAQQCRGNFFFMRGTMTFIEQANCFVRPNRPMTEQAADDAPLA